ncbi:MAG: radical SAM protein [Phycisphaerales bacterium]|nr:MAG: radical SAM protein [Phycisphaerales bacterium]
MINTNRMAPPIGPLALDYIAGAAGAAGIDVDIVDLSLVEDVSKALQDYFSAHSPQLVGLSFRNVDDCFWPSAQSFVPDLTELVSQLRNLTDAAIVIGGVGFSIFAERIVEQTGADFGVRGDGEQAIISLLNELQQSKRFALVPGLLWRDNGAVCSNKPAWPWPLSLPTSRTAINNLAYLQQGGQCGIETKRGCDRNCIYCADPLAKGPTLRLRKPREVADEVESLIAQGVDVLHLCDSEFNISRKHASEICGEFIRRSLRDKVRWYTYMAVRPFDAELAKVMRLAGCVGIDFTGDSASTSVLDYYRAGHRREDLASAVRLCRDNGIKVMIDLLLGGPGETPETLAETIDYVKKIGPDAAGAPLGVRVYPGTEMADILAREGPAETNPNVRRKYHGPVDLFEPTFYISQALGPEPARLVKDLIAGDKRFFEPMEELPQTAGPSTDHNYNENLELVEAIEGGARGAYWDILRRLR